MATTITLWCYSTGIARKLNVGEVFPVTISQDALIHKLREEVLGKLGAEYLATGTPQHLKLFTPGPRISISIDSQEKFLDGMGQVMVAGSSVLDRDAVIEALPSKKVSEYFTGPVENTLQVIVEAPRPFLAYEYVIQGHINDMKSKPTPSTGAQVSGFSNVQHRRPILNGRPHKHRGTPISLYHRVFDEFKRQYNNPPQATPEIKRLVHKLCVAAASVYRDETERSDTLRPIYTDLLRAKFIEKEVQPHTGVVGSFVPDGLIGTFLPLLDAWACRSLVEEKNEIGTGRCDPNIQATLAFCKYYAQEKASVSDIAFSCCCPGFVVAIAGPWMVVHGAVLTDVGFTVQPLTDMINLRYDSHDEGQFLKICGLFMALSRSLAELDEWYTRFFSISRPRGKAEYWPSIRAYQGLQFEYLERLGGGADPTKLVFKARTTEPEGRDIVVKFTTSYCQEAHVLLAQSSLAPQLLYYTGGDSDFERPGGLEMAIMEYISPVGKCGPQAQHDVRRALELLHANDLVFGDLRAPNVLATETGAMLVDFDWCGIEHQTFYPLEVNPHVKWPKGAEGGTPILRTHDWHMFDIMFPSQ